MKKITIFYILLLFTACSPQNNSFTNRNAQKFKAYYNIIFNSKEALETEITNRNKSFTEDYYSGYIPLIPHDAVSLQKENSKFPTDIQLNFSGGENENKGGTEMKGATILEISEVKALKAIEKHSMNFGGEEKNPYIFDAYMLLAKSRMYQTKYLEANDAIQTIKKVFKNDKRLPLAKILEAQNFTNYGDLYRANEIYLELQNQLKLKKKYKALASIYYSEMLIKNNQKEEAVLELEKAYKLNKNNELRSRISFLKGQLLANLNRKNEAKASFLMAYSNATNFEFEIKSQIEVAKLSQGDKNDYIVFKNHLEKLAKKGTYTSRRNELYYALGKLAQQFKMEEDEALFFKKSVKEKISDGQIRGLAYYELGKKHFLKDDYISAGNYYDSAVAVMKHQPTLEKLKISTNNIKKLTKNFYLIKKNDSILKLINLPEKEKLAIFNELILKLKEKETQAENLARKEKRSKGFDTGDYNGKNQTNFANNSFSNEDAGKAKFYFANQSNVASGISDFKKTWGERSLVDNWRFQNKSASIQEQKNLAMGKTDAPNPRRFETSYYLEQLPSDKQKIDQLKLDRDTASLGMGIMYYQLFDNYPLATKTFFNLVENKPVEDLKLQALYQIFYINFENNPDKANLAKKIILEEFPYSSYAEFVRNPIKTGKKTYNPELEKVYLNAYEMYLDGKFLESKSLIQATITANKNDALIPKFSLLDTFITAKTAGKEVMILQLEQIVLNYPKTPEGIKAKKMLEQIKSDLKLNITDENAKPKQIEKQKSSEEVEKLLKEQMENEELERQKKQKPAVIDEPQGPSLYPVHQGPKKIGT